MTKRFKLALLLWLTSAWFPLVAQSLTLDSCYAMALRNYPLVRQFDLIEKSKEYTLSNAGKNYLPQVSLTGIGAYIFGGVPSIGPSENSDFKFIGLAQVNQTIWDGGATKTQKEIIAASAESEKASLEVALHELRSRVNQLFFGILMADEQLAILARHEVILENNTDRIRLMNENGLAFTTDLDEIRVEQLKLQQQRIEAEYVREGYVRMLSFLIGIPLDDNSRFEKPESLSTIPTEILRPEMALYESQRQLINARDRMRKVNNMPKFGILGAGILIAPELDFGIGTMSSLGVLGLSASWNISGIYRNTNDKKLSEIKLNQVGVQEQTFLFNTELQTTQTMAAIARQRAILDTDDEIVLLRESIREGHQLKYENGMGTLMELLDATEKENEARTLKSLHEMQLLMSLYEYKTTTGN